MFVGFERVYFRYDDDGESIVSIVNPIYMTGWTDYADGSLYNAALCRLFSFEVYHRFRSICSANCYYYNFIIIRVLVDY